MKKEKRVYNPVVTLVLIFTALSVAVIFDVLINNGRNLLWEKESEEILTSSISINELQRRHEMYMEDGILPPYSSRNPDSIPLKQAAVDKDIEPFLPLPPIPEGVSLPHSKPQDETTVASTNKEDGLQAIEPASGKNDLDIAQPPPFPDGSKSVVNSIQSQTQEKDELGDLLAETSTKIPTETEEKNFVTPVIKEPVSIKKGDKPKIAIIIDDMGLSLRGRQLEIMSYPLTLSYLPYAENLKARTEIAKKNGHELMVHMPMEAMRDKDGGPRVLNIEESDEEFKSTVDWALSQFTGFVGINNHMGSKLTQDKNSMIKFMELIKNRNVYFVDSKTIGSSVAEDIARQYGIPHAARDVFLDHEISVNFVKQALNDLEAIAKNKGSAIAIGHPHKETIEVLKEWLPTLESKGIEIVPVSQLIKKEEPKLGPDLQIAKQQQIQLDGKIYNEIEPSASEEKAKATGTNQSTVNTPLDDYTAIPGTD